MLSRIVGLAAAVSVGALSGPQGQRLPQDLSDWQIEYTVSGGIAGHVHAVTIAHDGRLLVVDSRLGDRVSERVPAELMQRAEAFLASARIAKAGTAGRVMADAIASSLVVSNRDRRYAIEPTPDLLAILRDAFDGAVVRALVGFWRQSAWKLCTPVAQLAPSDVDPPIERLSVRADGSFDVTWPSPPNVIGIIHLPAYEGRYTVVPAEGSIRLHITSAISAPRDFSGQGRFSIADRTLTVRNVWFGTTKARQKPDVCELTFTKY